MPALDAASLGRSLLVYGVVRVLVALPQLFLAFFAAGRFWDGDAVWVGALMGLNAVVAVGALVMVVRLLRQGHPRLQPSAPLFLLALFDGALFVALWLTASSAALRLVSMFLIFLVVDLFAGWTTRTVRRTQA